MVQCRMDASIVTVIFNLDRKEEKTGFLFRFCKLNLCSDRDPVTIIARDTSLLKITYAVANNHILITN